MRSPFILKTLLIKTQVIYIHEYHLKLGVLRDNGMVPGDVGYGYQYVQGVEDVFANSMITVYERLLGISTTKGTGGPIRDVQAMFSLPFDLDINEFISPRLYALADSYADDLTTKEDRQRDFIDDAGAKVPFNGTASPDGNTLNILVYLALRKDWNKE